MAHTRFIQCNISAQRTTAKKLEVHVIALHDVTYNRVSVLKHTFFKFRTSHHNGGTGVMASKTKGGSGVVIMPEGTDATCRCWDVVYTLTLISVRTSTSRCRVRSYFV